MRCFSVQAAAHVGGKPWGAENSSARSKKLLEPRLKTGGAEALSDPLTYLLGLKSI